MCRKGTYQALDGGHGVFRGHFVAVGYLARNFRGSFAALQSAPDQHCSLIQRVIALRIQVNEYSFSTIEFRIYDVTVRLRGKGCGQTILSLRLIASIARSCRCNDHRK